jgi:RNA polymerase sigma-70 factor (ECF subfamily)
VQEAYVVAVERWALDGVPANPGAWITTAARNRALDRVRRERTGQAKLEELARRPAVEEEPVVSAVADDQLRLLFTCCHPALAPEAQVALTLRLVGGLTTAEIARSFLVPEATMAQRLVRAKRKIRVALIPFRIPADSVLPDRVGQVLATIYLSFNEGNAASNGPALVRRDLCRDAIRLARLVVSLMPDEPEAHGLHALLLLQDSRSESRTAADGSLVLLPDQDRSRWDAVAIAEGRELVTAALRRRRPGPYQLQAAIAAVHAEAPTAGDTDWHQIVALYGELLRLQPTPVVRLNAAVALAMAEGAEAALPVVDRLAADLDAYPPFHAARADLLRRLERWTDAEAAYERAVASTTNDVERAFFGGRIAEVRSRRGGLPGRT